MMAGGTMCVGYDNYWEMDDVIATDEGLQSDAYNKNTKKGGKNSGTEVDASAGILSGFGYTFVGFLFAFCTYSTIQNLRTPVDKYGKYSKVAQEPGDGEEDLDKI